MFDAKVAILVLDDLPLWQKLNVTAFLVTGIAGAALDAVGEPYEDGAGRRYARLLGQPILIFAATPEDLLRRTAYLWRSASPARLSTRHEAANREAFRAERAEAPDLVGLALRGPKDVDKAAKGGKLHP